jgi:hypothetical protein
MDALTIVCNTSFQAVFIARADIFKGKLQIHILNFMNISKKDGINSIISPISGKCRPA